MSELVYAGRTIKEIARMDDWQLIHVFFRKRDKYGRLVRHDPDLPPWVHVDEDGMRRIPKGKRSSFARMYKTVKLHQGLDEPKAKELWEQYKAANPKLGKGGKW